MKTKPNTRNPRTENQQAQRAQLTNLVTTYQILSSFIRGAYPSKLKNLSDYNMFIKENLSSRVKVYLNKAEAFQKACIVAPYNISEGRLQGIETVAQGDVLRTSLRVPRSFRINDDTTVEDVSMAMLRANPQMQEGDQISILHLIQHVPEKGVPHVTWKQYDFTLDIVSYGAIHSEFYSDVPKSLFRVNDGCIETEAGIEMGGVAYVLSREVGRKVQISTQSIVLTPDNSIYKEYSSEEKKKEAARSYAVIAKKKTVTPKKAIIQKNEYLHGFISRNKKILSMKKILIALVLIFGITIAAQNNTTGQEKPSIQEVVDLKLQMQELKISEMQKSIEDKIGMQDKYVESINSRFGFWLGLFGGLMTFLSIGSGFLVYYLNKRTHEVEKDMKEKLAEIIEIKKAAEKELNLMIIEGKEKLNSMVVLEEKTNSVYNKLINNPQIEKQSKEQKEELSSYIEEIKRKKPESEYTAKDWFLLGYDAQMKEKHDDACFYYNKANEIDSNNASIYNNWGNALLDLAKLKSTPDLYEESIIKYKKAIESKPDLAEAYNNWGHALSALAILNSDEALYKESFEKYSKANELNPNDASIYTNWGIALYALAVLNSDEVLYKESFEKYSMSPIIICFGKIRLTFNSFFVLNNTFFIEVGSGFQFGKI
ncbi:hypothetical protein EZS27_010129 [termite gut metagenome]|uniref:Uncharacterized protein n=1 Tax=termite gut metagenome TaxID=433724 RepID=A0A5J4S7N9_9ZZZZ